MAKQSDSDVLSLLDSLEKESAQTSGKRAAKPKDAKDTATKDDDDIMGFLDSLTRSGAVTPKPGAVDKPLDNTTTDKPVELERSEPETPTTQPTTLPVAEKASGTGETDPIASISSWWSRNKTGIWDTATSAVKQAEARVKELQPEVQSSIGLGRGLLQSTLSSVLDTIAPPINRHEQLKINVFYDMVGYPAIDTIVYNVFDRVMQQVEGGGDLTMVVQKGEERRRRGSDAQQQRELGLFKGSLDQAIKLAAANIEEFVRSVPDETKSSSSTEQPTTGEPGTDAPLIRTSDIYLSIQPACTSPSTTTTAAGMTILSSSSPSTFEFVVVLSDPSNDIRFTSVSQPFPLQWAEWLDSPDSTFQAIEADPREWVLDWIEEGLGLAVGIAAQSYVSKRMGIDALFKQTPDAAANVKPVKQSDKAESSEKDEQSEKVETPKSKKGGKQAK